MLNVELMNTVMFTFYLLNANNFDNLLHVKAVQKSERTKNINLNFNMYLLYMCRSLYYWNYRNK